MFTGISKTHIRNLVEFLDSVHVFFEVASSLAPEIIFDDASQHQLLDLLLARRRISLNTDMLSQFFNRVKEFHEINKTIVRCLLCEEMLLAVSCEGFKDTQE